ncbi:MAG: Flp pilus assembly complex ATPase component TadA [Candidatus Aenigmarchaeota archaeon]|nr:Flp pilus assembly complex ATPase component TadA [Candidatus Aenigmarchaeota archaeon]
MGLLGGEELIVPDTSILISRKLTQMIDKGELKNVKVLVPEFVLDELQAQASKGKEIGFLGLEEIKDLRKRKIKLEFVGRKPTLDEIKLAKSGRIDNLIREVAQEKKATLYTKDLVQAVIAEVYNVKVKYIKDDKAPEELDFIPHLTKSTMSLHFKVGCLPYAKRGSPKKWKIERIGKEKLSKKKFDALANSVLRSIRGQEHCFVEFEEYGAMVLQVRDMRIAITRPPFSEGEEITIVRPIVKLTLDDYKLSDKLKNRIGKSAEGVIIAGPPGSGKSTLAASLAEFYHSLGKVVKTMEQPRDLQVNPEITQYAPLAKDFGRTAEILLLVRPDYTIYDELRSVRDFHIFSDMRLAGVGMVGVVHASSPADAVQRFINKVELGMLPNIVDTIIFVDKGKIEEVFSLKIAVKVPAGMKEQDLARPVIEVRSFETEELRYEIYVFGDETVVMPFSASGKEGAIDSQGGLVGLAVSAIEREVSKYDKRPIVEPLSDGSVRVYVSKKSIAKIIGKGGKNIEKLQEKLGVHIDLAEK